MLARSSRLARRGQFSLGGLCGCCSSGTLYCVKGCSPAVPIAGATIQVYDSAGTTLLSTYTTNSSGCATLTESGSHVVKVLVSGIQCNSGPENLNGTTITRTFFSCNGYICCGSYLIPKTLTLTDAAGPLSFQYCSSCSASFPTWTGGHAVTRTSCAITTPGGVCTAASPSSGPVRVCYSMQCVSPSTPLFQITRSWGWVNQTPGPGTPIWFQDPSGFSPAQNCSVAPPAPCGSPHTNTASGSANPSSSAPFAVSFTMADSGGNVTGDPVVSGGGDTVAVSA